MKGQSTHTQRAFRLEARRWLAWLMLQKRGLHADTWLDKATTEDAANYLTFLYHKDKSDFPPDVLWAANLKRQPFQKKKMLAPATVDRAIDTLKAFYADLAGMVVTNDLVIGKSPFARFKTSAINERGEPRQKALSAEDRQYVEAALEYFRQEAVAPDARPEKLAIYHQHRWVWKALLHSGMRRQELADARAGDLYLDTDEEKQRVWKLRVRGKGSRGKGKKIASIPLSSHFMKEMAIYRQFHGLSPIPDLRGYHWRENDNSVDKNHPAMKPLVLPVRGDPRHVSGMLVYRSMKALLEKAAELARQDNNFDSAGHLEASTSHSSRHTCVTRIVDETGDVTLAQDMARHASILTTRRYKTPSTARLSRALEKLD